MTLNKLLMSLRDQFPLIPNKILYGSSLSFESIQTHSWTTLAPLTPIGPTNLSLTVAPGREATGKFVMVARNRKEQKRGNNAPTERW